MGLLFVQRPTDLEALEEVIFLRATLVKRKDIALRVPWCLHWPLLLPSFSLL